MRVKEMLLLPFRPRAFQWDARIHRSVYACWVMFPVHGDMRFVELGN